MNKLYHAVLWDMDGTLLDSAEYHWLAWREALAAEGYDLSRERFTATFGQRNDTILRGYFGSDFPLGEIDRVGAVKEARYRELVKTRGVEPLPGVRRWLDRLKASGWRQAVASAAPRLNIEVVLAALDIADRFDAIVSGEDVQYGKPDPQVYLTAAARLGVPPVRCVVVEDAPAGVEGARRAGMRAIGVLTTHAALQANRVVRTLDELPDQAFDELIRET